jgi:hypothetical protein
LIITLCIPALLIAQEWRPVSSAPSGQAGITLGKPQVTQSANVSAYPGLPLPPASPIVWHTANRPGDLDLATVPTFSPPQTLFRAGYQTPATPEEQFNCGVIPGQAGAQPPPPGAPPPPPGTAPATHPIADWWNHLWNKGTPSSSGGLFGSWDCRSDQCFKDFISPVSNPAYFEDPRSLTEIRPIFMFQKAPGDNPLMEGGKIFVLNLQGRVSINDRWSLVLNRLGFARVEPGSGAMDGFTGGNGLTDIGVGTKYTFYRDDRSNTLAAAGINFEIPVGNESVLSGTGAGAEPYLSYGQAFGNWHLLAASGYRFGLSQSSSDFFFLSGHLDYSFFNRFYPLVEMNWYHYTSGGDKRVAGFEGADLFNLGSTDVGGHNILTVAAGFRFKFTEGFQTGLAFEAPLMGTKDLERWRVVFDLIFRF